MADAGESTVTDAFSRLGCESIDHGSAPHSLVNLESPIEVVSLCTLSTSPLNIH